MRMEQYLTFTDHGLWEVIVNGDSVSPVASANTGVEAIPDEHLLKFHACKDVKSLWEAIMNRFRGNKESKKMQKIILKQNYENFVASSQEGLDKTYDRSLPSAWNTYTLIIRNKSDLDTLSMDDLYNNLKVYESEIKGKSSSSSNSQNVAFVSSDNTSNTNEAVNTAHDVSAAIHNEDLEQIDTDDLEEMDLKWQVAMLTIRVKRFIKKTGRTLNFNGIETVGFDKTKVECYDYHRRVETPTNALVITDKMGYDWSYQAKEGPIDFTLMAHSSSGSSSSSSSDTENEAVYKEDIVFLNAKDKTSLGYDSQMNESEVVHSVFNSRESDVDNSPVNDRFKIGEWFYAVPHPYTGNYMLSRPDLSFVGLDDYVYKTKDTDSDNDSVFRPKSDLTKPKFTKINFVKSGENVKSVNKENTHRQVEYLRKSQSLRDNRRNWNGMMTQKLVNGFESQKKACFVCGINAAKQSSPRAATSISTAGPVNTAAPKPKVNDALPITYSYFKAHLPVRRAFNKKSAAKTNNFNEKANTARVNNVTTTGPKAVVSAAEGNRENAVKSSDQGIFDNGCSRHMTGNKSFLTDYQEIDGGFVAFGRSPKGGGLTCLFVKATIDESNLRHRRLGQINFKTMNKLVRGNLKGKQHKASCKTKLVSSISQPLQMLHMDLFGPTSIRSINHKTYFLVVTDDFSRFSWVFFLATKDETSGILKTFITSIKNQINHKVKIIRCDNGTEFKNNDMNQFCGMKGIKREFSVARTPQQNGVAKRNNRTLIEAARTMLVDSLLPITFWAEAVNTACYVQNRVLVTKPHNKTPYELLHGRPPSISFMRPFECPVTILNTLDPLCKFDRKVDEGFLVRYFINSKAFRVFNTRTRKVEENLHIRFLENKPNVTGSRPGWLFDIDLLTNSMNYEPVTAGNQTNSNAGIKDNVDAVPTQQYILQPLLYDSRQSLNDAVADDAGKKTNEKPANEGERNGYATSTNRVSTVSLSVSTAGQSFDNANDLLTDPLMPDLEDIVDLLNTGIFSGAYDDEDEDVEANLNNLETTINVSPIPTTRIHKDHPKDQIIRDINSAIQIRRMTKISEEHALMDVKSAFLYGTIEEEVMQRDDEIFFSQDKYVADILKKFNFATVKTTSTPIETNKALLKDEKAEGVDVHLYRSMIRSLMYLTASRPDIMFAVYACARFQVTPKVSHLRAVKRIFRYLKGQPKLGFWYLGDSPFNLEAFFDSDYAGASLDRKSTTRGVVDPKSNP
ncbi:putative ribonuclease H-like domain-containing protein [Tanacetum coccineum]|uniref:Ribonuclease H-like domain-containing protein n=1 Tax=Tanacetum coccineum TaxID=301880 RepID=A0ABQ5EH59_9ASTR